MTSTVFVDKSSATPIVAAWLNDINVAVYTALGSGGVAPATAAAVISNLGVVKSADLSASSGSTLVNFIQAGTGAVSRTLQTRGREWISVKDFGAVGDGSTDDTTAIQNAITAVQNVPGNILWFPPAQLSAFYKVTSTLTVSKPITIVGSNASTCAIKGIGLAAGTYLIDVNGAINPNLEFVSISGLQLLTDGTTAHLMRLNNVSNSSFSNLQLRNANNGIVLTGTREFALSFDQILHNGGLTGSTIFFTAFTGGTGYTFKNCLFGGGDAVSIDSTSTVRSLAFTNCQFESSTSTHTTVNGTLEGCVFSGGHCEGLTSNTSAFNFYPSAGNSVFGLSIHGFHFGRTLETNAVSLGGNGGTVRGFDISGNKFLNYTNAVNLNGDGQSGTITGNQLGGTTNITNTQRSGVLILGNEKDGVAFSDYYGTALFALVQGTFTPIDSSGAGLTFSTANGFYQKVGNMVYWQAVIVYPATANGSGAVIGGLPYTVTGGANSQGRSGAFISATDATTVIGVLQIESTTTFKPYKSGLTQALNSDLSSKSLYVGGFFTV